MTGYLKQPLRLDQFPAQAGLRDDTLQRSLPNFPVMWQDGDSITLGRRLLQHDMAAYLARPIEAILLEDAADLSAESTLSLGMREFERRDFDATVQPALNLLGRCFLQKQLDCFLDHVFRFLNECPWLATPNSGHVAAYQSSSFSMTTVRGDSFMGI